jgi:predicted Zn finger-like uncharacterized protein
MKLVCERCKATYSIADDKVRGKVVSLKCKTCGGQIQAKGPGATADRMPAVDARGQVKGGPAAAAARLSAARSSVLDQPLRANKSSLKPTADLTKPASAAGTAAAPPERPAVSRFASDEGGRLRRAAPNPGAKPAAGAGSPAGVAEKRPTFGAGVRGGSTEDGEEGPKTTIASYDSIVAALGAATAPPPDEWYLSVDGDQRGPFKKDALEEEIPKYDDQELYVWREGFSDWLPPAEVPELEVGLRLTAPPVAGVVRGAKLPTADRAESLRQSPWSPASRGVPDADATDPPWKGQSHAEPLPPPPVPGEDQAVPRKLGKESSGAQVVPIQHARDRAAARPHRGGTPAGTTPAKPAHEAGESPRVPGAGHGEGAGRVTEVAGPDSAGASSRAGVALPLQAPEPEPADDHELVVTEPSQVVRMRSYAIPGELEDAKAAVRPYQDLDHSESGVHGRIDELAMAAGVVQPTAHKMNRVLLIAAVGGGLATLSLLGVVVYLVARGPQVQVREIVRLKSPEELGVDSDLAVARLLAEKQFAERNPGAGSSGSGSGAGPAAPGRDPGTKKGALTKPTAAGGPAPAKRDPKATGGTGNMAGFFKSQPGVGVGGGVAAPNLASPPPVAQPAGRRVSDEEIVKAINRQRGTLSVCYNRALKHDNTLKSVRLDVTVKFGYSGRPTSVVINDSKHRTSFLGTCLGDTIRRWTFPSGGDDRTTVMPLVLQGE